MMTYTFRFLSVGMGYIGSQMPAVSYILGYIINSKLHLKLKDLTSLIPRPHIDFIAPLRSWAKGLLATVATQDKQFFIATSLYIELCN